MTLDELVNETLAQKNQRLRQEKCSHVEIYSSVVSTTWETYTNSFCWDCGKSWRAPTLSQGETDK